MDENNVFSEHLSYFEPYESKTPWHEDQLTRAYLTILRLVPPAHQDFVQQIRACQHETRSIHALPLDVVGKKCDIYTQKSEVPKTRGRLVSLLLSDDFWTQDTRIHPVDRGARYDGVICYADDWIVTIENKPRVGNVWEDQLRPSLQKDSEVLWEEQVVSLSWRTVIHRLGELIAKGGLSGTEKLLLQDFLAFVDKNFEYLKPYYSFELCGQSAYLLTLRCKELLASLGLGKVDRHKGWGHVVRIDNGPLSEIKLQPTDDVAESPSIELVLCAGVGCPRSRDLLDRLDVAELDNLSTVEGWTVRPDLSFRYRGAGYAWSCQDWSMAPYISFWRDGDIKPRRYHRDDTGFDGLFDRLLQAKIILKERLPELRKNFSNTKRTFIELCAGIALTYTWPLEKAVALDAKGEFAADMRQKLRQATHTWQQDVPA